MKAEFHCKNNTIQCIKLKQTLYIVYKKRGEQLLFQKNVISVVVKNFTQKKAAHRQDCIVRNATNGLNG